MIGGAYGLADELTACCFSRVVFVVDAAARAGAARARRTVVRAGTIVRGEPYHK